MDLSKDPAASTKIKRISRKSKSRTIKFYNNRDKFTLYYSR